MEVTRGLVVRSKAGHDKGGFFTVLKVEGEFAFLCNGKQRPLEHPKKKKLRHIAPTATKLTDSSMKTNREIRRSLRFFQNGGGGDVSCEEVISCQNRT